MATNDWVGGAIGSFGTEGSSDANWSLGHVPTSSENAVIDTGASAAAIGASTVEDVGSISLGTNDVLLINSDAFFAAQNGTGPNVNNGAINVSYGALILDGNFDNGSSGAIELASTSTSQPASMFINGSISLTGSGVIEMTIGGPVTSNEITGDIFDSTTPSVVDETETIGGTGTIGGDLNFTNDATIETNNNTSGSGGVLQIDGSAGVGSFTNNGLVEAQNGGTLIFGEDGDSSTITNSDTIELVSTGTKTVLEIAGTVTLNGGGTLTVPGSQADVDQVYIENDANSATLNNVNNTITGGGTIQSANGASLTVHNEGVIDANGGVYLYFFPTTVTNDGGTLEATAGALSIADGTINNTGGIIESTPGGWVGIAFETITGSGAIEINADSYMVFDDATIAGTVQFNGPNAGLTLEEPSVSEPGSIGEIAGFTATDSIDVDYVTFASGDHVIWTQTKAGSGTLALDNSGGTTLLTLNLLGEYTSSDFSVTSSGGNALIQEIANWFQIDSGTPVALAGGDFEGLGSAQLIASESGAGTYLWSAGSWTKIDGGVDSLMAAANFYGTSNGNNNNIDLAAYEPGVGTYIWNTSVGWAKIDGGAVAALTAGNFKGTGNGLVASETGAGTYLWSFTGGWTKIDGGVYALMAAGDFYGTSNGNGNHSDVAAYDPGVGTYIWSASAGWSKIDSGAASTYAAGNFLGTSDGNNNQTDLAAYFAGSGTYIWSANAGWSKIDSGTGAGMAAVNLNANGQNELLEYFPGAGMYEWQNGVGWKTYDSTSALPTGATQALFATGNFQGGSVVDAAVGFSGVGGLWLDPPVTATSSESSDASSAAASTPITLDNGASVDLNAPSTAAVTLAGSSGTPQLDQSTAFATPIAGPSGTPQNEQSPAFASPIAGSTGTPQNEQSPAFAGTIGGVAGQDQPTLGYSANSGNSGGAPTAANIALLGSYMASSFVSSSDGNGGTPISDAAQVTAQTTPLAPPHAAV
jgi:hypothetical protein